MTLDQFNAQLSTMEDTLLGMYKQKTLLVGAREALRFQYVTATKSKWTALLSAMFQQAYSQNNSDGVTLLSSITAAMQKNTVMADINGNIVTGWSPILPGNTGSGGGVNNTSFLAPIENIISKPFNGPTNPNQNPAYKIYGYTPWSQPTDYYLIVIYPKYMDTIDRTKNSVNIPFTIPPSQDWCKNYFYTNQNILNSLNTAYPFAASVLAATYTNIGSAQSVMQEFKDTLTQIIYKTQLIIQLQIQIDSAVNDLTSFVSSYAQFGSSIDVAQVLLNLQNAAEQAANPPPPPPPAPPQVVEVTPQPIVDTTPAPAPVPTSKLPLILGAIAGVILVAGSKKSG